MKSHSFPQRHADVACPEDAALPIVDGGYSVHRCARARARVCMCVRAPVTMPGYRHVRYYGNSLQIKTPYNTRGCDRDGEQRFRVIQVPPLSSSSSPSGDDDTEIQVPIRWFNETRSQLCFERDQGEILQCFLLAIYRFDRSPSRLFKLLF